MPRNMVVAGVLLSLVVVGCYSGPYNISEFEGQTFSGLDEVHLDCGREQTFTDVFPAEWSSVSSPAEVLEIVHAVLGKTVYRDAVRAGEVWLLVLEDGSVEDAIDASTGFLKFCDRSA